MGGGELVVGHDGKESRHDDTRQCHSRNKAQGNVHVHKSHTVTHACGSNAQVPGPGRCQRSRAVFGYVLTVSIVLFYLLWSTSRSWTGYVLW